jgi:hypothetical protein
VRPSYNRSMFHNTSTLHFLLPCLFLNAANFISVLTVHRYSTNEMLAVAVSSLLPLQPCSQPRSLQLSTIANHINWSTHALMAPQSHITHEFIPPYGPGVQQSGSRVRHCSGCKSWIPLRQIYITESNTNRILRVISMVIQVLPSGVPDLLQL